MNGVGHSAGDWDGLPLMAEPGHRRPDHTPFPPRADQRQLDRLCALGRRSLLEINCRNTRPIAAHVRGLTGIGYVTALLVLRRLLGPGGYGAT